MSFVLSAWESQAATLDEFNDQALLEENSFFSPIVTIGDSVNAGNCLLVTKRWAAHHGWAKRTYIPAHWLIPHLNKPEVRRVAMSVAKAVRKALAA